MQQNKIVILIIGALAIGIVAGYFLSNHGYENIAAEPTVSTPSSTARSTGPQKSTCDGPSSINLGDLYLKRNVTYRDASGTTGVASDECTEASQQSSSSSRSQANKVYCYENPFGSGNIVPGKIVYDCPFGCADGACKKLEASSGFSYPYPISWAEGDTTIYLTRVSLGDLSIAADIESDKLHDFSAGGLYRQNHIANVYGLTMFLKIATGHNGPACTPSLLDSLRRLVNENGDFAAPELFYNVCVPQNSSLNDVRVVFVVSDTDKQFEFTTGGTSNIFFSVAVQDDGTVKLEKEATSESG